MTRYRGHYKKKTEGTCEGACLGWIFMGRLFKRGLFRVESPQVFILMFLVSPAIFGAIHIAAWHVTLPTDIELQYDCGSFHNQHLDSNIHHHHHHDFRRRRYNDCLRRLRNQQSPRATDLEWQLLYVALLTDPDNFAEAVTIPIDNVYDCCVSCITGSNCLYTAYLST